MFYTRTGDSGTTGLFGTKERIDKCHPMFEALGSIDELASLVGLSRAYLRTSTYGHLSDELYQVQEALFVVQAQLAGADKHITHAQVEALETVIDRIGAHLRMPTSFVVPGATLAGALFDYVRAVSRRAERAVLGVKTSLEHAQELHAYLNRLSSLFYVLARCSAQTENAPEYAPTYDQAP